MKLKVLFSRIDDSLATAEFGPYDWVEATDREIRVPVDLNVMDDEALRFRDSSEEALIRFENLLAARQRDGSWELREMAGREAYDVYLSWHTVRVSS